MYKNKIKMQKGEEREGERYYININKIRHTTSDFISNPISRPSIISFSQDQA